MNRQAQAVIMLLLGGAVLRVSLTDMYLRYVKEGLQPFLIAAGVVLVVGAIMTLWYELRRDLGRDEPDPRARVDHYGVGPGTRPETRHSHEPAAGHGHGADGAHREPRVGWLLILPVLGLLLVAPPALGSYAAGQSGTALSAQEASDYPPLPDGDPARISLLDYASRAVFDKGASLRDRRVEVTAFLATNGDGEQVLARMMLSCCAADARPIKVGMSGNAPTGLAADTWVTVTGRYTAKTATDPVNHEKIPYLDIETWQQVDAPKQQYE